MQRELRTASRKEGLVAIDSARALINSENSRGSFTQPGTNPQRKSCAVRLPICSVMATIGWVGVML